MDDARAVRSRERLTAAVLELAATRPAHELTVAEVARAAGVHRSTFYEHGASPAGVLRALLRTELDVARERHLGGAGPDDGGDRDWDAAVRGVTLDVLDHLERHRAVYVLGLAGAADGGLRVLLSEHFRASVASLLARGVVTSPVADHAVAAGFIADGVVGAIAVWLAEEPLRPQGAVLDDLRLLLPPWWPLGDTAG